MTSIIVATVHDDYTVAFIGTSRGHLKKVRHYSMYLCMSPADKCDKCDKCDSKLLTPCSGGHVVFC